MIVTSGGPPIGYAAHPGTVSGGLQMDPAMQVSTPPTQREAASAAEQGARRVPELHDPHLFLNRELSWLQFNLRVLDGAAEAPLPTFERLKFLAIVSSTLRHVFRGR